jgi:hypothetical protein
MKLKEEFTERIKNVTKFYQLVRGIFWRWEMPKKRKLSSLKITTVHDHTKIRSRNLDMDLADISKLKAAKMRI